MSNKNLNLTLKIWRQKGQKYLGKFETYHVKNISKEISFLEMLDILNNDLILLNKDPIAFDHDCREGICGMCSLYINGRAHGPDNLITTCQLHMRVFKNETTIYVEPWRSKAFPIIKDLIVDRSSLDRIIYAGGFISINTSDNIIDANTIPISKNISDKAFDAASCIGCGACIATCKNSSAMLFVSAKISQFAMIPQGKIESKKRVIDMVTQMDKEGFGNCTNTGACEIECPKGISIENIARMNNELIKASILNDE